MSSRARRSGRHFPVGGGGRWRHVPVVDTGCGCRPRRPRQLLMSLPSFLRPSPKPRSGGGGGSQYSSSSLFPSSASTASFSSSSAATYTTTYSCSSSNNNSSYYSSSHVYKQQPPPPPPPQQQQQYKTARASSPAARKRRSRVKKRYEKMEEADAAVAAAEEEEDVGVAVEKESSDPRADFRESMVQMVVEMGLCNWDDLRCMLRRLLALNAPRHHAAILTAFAEVCAQLTAPPAPPPPPVYHYHYHY